MPLSIGGLLEQGHTSVALDDMGLCRLRPAGSLSVAAETPLGPFIQAGGPALGNGALHLIPGRILQRHTRHMLPASSCRKGLYSAIAIAMRHLFLALLLLLGVRAEAAVPTVAAAADLRYAMEELVAAYSRETGRQVKVSYGSSGLFHQQIRNGAPFELFLSADEAYAERLHAAGLTRDSGTVYALGRLVLFAPDGSALAVDPQMKGLGQALSAGRVRRFAIANPAHAPYGARAREALQAAGLWSALEGRLVMGENVVQALQFATSGGADGGIVALSLVNAPGFAKAGRWALLPADLHSPLRQRMVLTGKAGAEAGAFHNWLKGPQARAILARHGFTPPSGPR